MRIVNLMMVVAGFACLLSGSNGIAASNWKPERNVEIIAGTNPGGAADRTARTIQRIIQGQKLIEVPAVVVNKPGAGGALGWVQISQRPGDGTQIAIATPPLVTNHITGRSKLHHSDLTPLAMLFGEYFPFVVRADSSIKTGKDLIAQLKKDPTSISIAVASAGGANHISVGLVASKAGVDVRKLKVVVFNSGGDTLTALLGGHVQLVAANPASAESMVKDGRARAIAVASDQRLPGVYAAVPTWREQGVNAVLMSWRGVVGAPGLGASEISYWEHVFRNMTREAEWLNDLAKNNWKESFMDSATTKKFLDSEYEDLKEVLSELNLINKKK